MPPQDPPTSTRGTTSGSSAPASAMKLRVTDGSIDEPVVSGPVVIQAPGPDKNSPLMGQALIITGLNTAMGAGLASMVATGWLGVGGFLGLFAAWVLLVGIVTGRQLAAPYMKLSNQLNRCAKSRSRHDAQALPKDRPDELGKIARAFIGLIETADRDARQVKNLRRTMDDRVDRAIHKATLSLSQKIHCDPMTGLGNRRFLDDELDKLVEMSLESGTPLLAIAIDLDHFKSVNDTLGHEAGDKIIKLAADLMRQGLRENDLTVRLGGDEFLVLMPNGTQESAGRYTQSLRQHFVQQAKVRFSGAPKVPNMSIGVAMLDRKKHVCSQDLLRAADNALYTAKKRGRGCTVGLANVYRAAG